MYPQSGNGIHIERRTDFPREIIKQIFLALVLCFLQPFHCNEIMIIDLFLFALLSFVWFVLTDCSPLVFLLKKECHRSDGERSLEWQTPVVAYPFRSLHNLCVVVVGLPDVNKCCVIFFASDKISTSLVESGLFKTRIGRNTSASMFAFFRQAPRVDVQAWRADGQTPRVDEVSSPKHVR